MSPRLVLMGPPGAGKGTQAVRLAGALGVPTISTGAIFRANIAQGTQLGIEAQRYTDAGHLVPDAVTNDMVRVRLGEADCAQGFVLDGYPRTVAQVEELAEILAGYGHVLDGVLELAVPDDELIARLLSRAQVEGRADDTEPVIRRRLEVYYEHTEPVSRLYKERGMLASVDGTGEPDLITERLLSAARNYFG